MKTTLTLSRTNRDSARRILDESPDGTVLELRPPRRTDDQNARLHSSIRDISRQVEWCGERMSQEDWKRVLIASLFGQRVVRGIHGGFVVIQHHSRDMTKLEVAVLQEFVYSFGTEHNVRWSDLDVQV